MTQFFKPTSAPCDFHILDVKAGWRRWDDNAKRYVQAREGETDARPYYVLRGVVPGSPDELIYDPDARIFPRSPQAGETWRVRREGSKTLVELQPPAAPAAPGSSLASHARVIAQQADVSDYLREILALTTMALNTIEEGRK